MAIKKIKYKNHQFLSSSRRGFVLIEIIISVAIISIAFGSLLSVGASVFNLSRLIRQTTTARSMATEELEAVRAWRDSTSWDVDGLGVVSTGETNAHYFFVDDTNTPNKWNINSGTETVEGFTRSVVFDRVSRDPTSGDIQSIYNPANDDPDTRKATVTIAWEVQSTQSLQIVTYFTNW